MMKGKPVNESLNWLPFYLVSITKFSIKDHVQMFYSNEVEICDLWRKVNEMVL